MPNSEGLRPQKPEESESSSPESSIHLGLKAVPMSLLLGLCMYCTGT